MDQLINAANSLVADYNALQPQVDREAETVAVTVAVADNASLLLTKVNQDCE